MNENDNVFGESLDLSFAKSIAQFNFRQLKNDNPGYTYSNINERVFLENGSYKYVIYWSRVQSEEITTTTSITEESIRQNAEEYTKISVVHKYTEAEKQQQADETGQNEAQQGSEEPDPFYEPEELIVTELTFNYKESSYITEIDDFSDTEHVEIDLNA